MPHIHEKIDFTAEVFIVYKNKVLLRMHDKYKFWASVGGHIELCEDPNEAAVREVKEEVGLDVVLIDIPNRPIYQSETCRELIMPRSLNRHRVSDSHEHIGMVFFARSETDAVVPEKPTDKWRWCTKRDLVAMDLHPEIKLYAESALKELSESHLL